VESACRTKSVALAAVRVGRRFVARSRAAVAAGIRSSRRSFETDYNDDASAKSDDRRRAVARSRSRARAALRGAAPWRRCFKRTSSVLVETIKNAPNSMHITEHNNSSTRALRPARPGGEVIRNAFLHCLPSSLTPFTDELTNGLGDNSGATASPCGAEWGRPSR